VSRLSSCLSEEVLNPTGTLRAGRVDPVFFLCIHHAEGGGGERLPPPALRRPPPCLKRCWIAVIPTKSEGSASAGSPSAICSC